MNNQALFHKFIAFTTAVLQVKHEMTKDLRAEDITPVQYSILEYIAVSQPVTLSEISDCQHMSMPNTSREIKKLCDKQLCEKVADAADRRKQYIRLTPEGQAMMDQAFQKIEARFVERIQGTAEEDLEEIGRALDLLQTHVFRSTKAKGTS